MSLSFKKLWHLLLDKDMLKKDLRDACGLSTTTMAKMSKGQNMNTDALVKICKYLCVDISDICEVILDDEENQNTEDAEHECFIKQAKHKRFF